jgi:hypothetical protein
MDDVTIESIVEPVGAAADPRKALLDLILEKFRLNPGKWVKLAVAGETPAVKAKKARALRSFISRLSKREQAYGAIGLIIDESGVQLNVYAKQQEPGGRMRTNKQKAS